MVKRYNKKYVATNYTINLLFKIIIYLILGHTHGGQFYFLRPLVYWRNSFLQGLYRDAAHGTQVYVSAGVNFWGPPVKMWNSCEIIKITLRRGETKKLEELNENLQNQKDKFL